MTANSNNHRKNDGNNGGVNNDAENDGIGDGNNDECNNGNNDANLKLSNNKNGDAGVGIKESSIKKAIINSAGKAPNYENPGKINYVTDRETCEGETNENLFLQNGRDDPKANLEFANINGYFDVKGDTSCLEWTDNCESKTMQVNLARNTMKLIDENDFTEQFDMGYIKDMKKTSQASHNNIYDTDYIKDMKKTSQASHNNVYTNESRETVNHNHYENDYIEDTNTALESLNGHYNGNYYNTEYIDTHNSVNFSIDENKSAFSNNLPEKPVYKEQHDTLFSTNSITNGTEYDTIYTQIKPTENISTNNNYKGDFDNYESVYYNQNNEYKNSLNKGDYFEKDECNIQKSDFINYEDDYNQNNTDYSNNQDYNHNNQNNKYHHQKADNNTIFNTNTYDDILNGISNRDSNLYSQLSYEGSNLTSDINTKQYKCSTVRQHINASNDTIIKDSLLCDVNVSLHLQAGQSPINLNNNQQRNINQNKDYSNIKMTEHSDDSYQNLIGNDQDANDQQFKYHRRMVNNEENEKLANNNTDSRYLNNNIPAHKNSNYYTNIEEINSSNNEINQINQYEMNQYEDINTEENKSHNNEINKTTQCIKNNKINIYDNNNKMKQYKKTNHGDSKRTNQYEVSRTNQYDNNPVLDNLQRIKCSNIRNKRSHSPYKTDRICDNEESTGSYESEYYKKHAKNEDSYYIRNGLESNLRDEMFNDYSPRKTEDIPVNDINYEMADERLLKDGRHKKLKTRMEEPYKKEVTRIYLKGSRKQKRESKTDALSISFLGDTNNYDNLHDNNINYDNLHDNYNNYDNLHDNNINSDKHVDYDNHNSNYDKHKSTKNSNYDDLHDNKNSNINSNNSNYNSNNSNISNTNNYPDQMYDSLHDNIHGQDHMYSPRYSGAWSSFEHGYEGSDNLNFYNHNVFPEQNENDILNYGPIQNYGTERQARHPLRNYNRDLLNKYEINLNAPCMINDSYRFALHHGPIKPDNEEDYIFSCDPCMKKFKRLSTLKIHIFSHLKEAYIYKCPKASCDSGFKSQSIAIKHIQHFHREERMHLVDSLKRSKFLSVFRSFTTLIDYYKIFNPNLENPFEKSFCFGCFTYPRSMHEHPCSKMFYSLTQCPSCKGEVANEELEKHVFSEQCRRPSPTVKDLD